MRRPVPTFIGIGAQRSGTTWVTDESEPRRFCRDLFAFLGVDPDHDAGEILHQRRNERPPLDMPQAIREHLTERYASQADDIQALTGLRTGWTARERSSA